MRTRDVENKACRLALKNAQRAIENQHVFLRNLRRDLARPSPEEYVGKIGIVHLSTDPKGLAPEPSESRTKIRLEIRGETKKMFAVSHGTVFVPRGGKVVVKEVRGNTAIVMPL